MAVHNIIPNTNVSFNDIRDTLNANGGSVTNDFVTAFQDRASINIWSYFKPFNSQAPFFDKPLQDSYGGLVYDSINKIIKWDRPTGGQSSPYRLGDFRGYEAKAIAPTIDYTLLTIPIDIRSARFTLSIRPYWGDTRYNWAVIMGVSNLENLKLKVEVYNSNDNLVDYNTVLVTDMDTTGRYRIDMLTNGLITNKMTYIYIKGYFCDITGAVLCPFPSDGDGKVKKPITILQRIYYMGTVEVDVNGFTASAALAGGEGSESTKCIIDVTNNRNITYNGEANMPIAMYRYRAYDGSVTTQWEGSLYLRDANSIPAHTTRSTLVSPGVPPSYESVDKWYIDFNVIMY